MHKLFNRKYQSKIVRVNLVNIIRNIKVYELTKMMEISTMCQKLKIFKLE